jgi:catechol 2,3-dioxygenase-like lactoylglutathione lyase family enzyme
MRTRIRILLPCLLVAVVAAGAVAVGLADVSGTRGYLVKQADHDLLNCAASMLSRRLVVAPVSDPAAGPCGAELLSTGGQLLTPLAPGAAAGPAIPSGDSWPAAHAGSPVTVPGAGTSESWLVLVEPVHYQPQRILYVYGPDDVRYVISGRSGPGPGGTLVVMTGLAAIGPATTRLAVSYAAAAGAVLVLLAAAAVALTRAIVRPLRHAAKLAEMAGQAAVAQQLNASRAAQASARRSAEQLSNRLAEVSLDLRTSVNVVAGFAERCRQRGQPQPGDLDRMMRRVAGEVARMEAAIQRLGPPAVRTGHLPRARPCTEPARRENMVVDYPSSARLTKEPAMTETETSAVPAVTGFHHFSPTVSDVEASAQWYERVFGMNRIPVKIPHYGAEEEGYAVLLIDPRSGIAIGLHHHEANPGQLFDEHRTGLDHISFAVADRGQPGRLGQLARRTRRRALRRGRRRPADALLGGRVPRSRQHPARAHLPVHVTGKGPASV